MSVPVSLSQGTPAAFYQDLFTRLSGADFGDWSPTRIQKLTSAEGWTIKVRGKRCRLIVPRPLLWAHLERGFEYPVIFSRLELVLAEEAKPRDFHLLNGVMTDVMGYPAPLVGGPGPWLRWRRDGGSDETPGTSVTLAFSRDQISVAFTPTRVAEKTEAELIELAEEIEDLFTHWQAAGRHPSLVGLDFPSRVLTDWEDVEDALTGVLTTLTHDIPFLGTRISVELGTFPEPTGSVSFTITEDGQLSLHCHPMAWGTQPNNETMQDLGWHRGGQAVEDDPGDPDATADVDPGAGSWRCSFRPPSQRKCAVAARILVETLQIFGIEPVAEGVEETAGKLHYRADYPGLNRTHLPGLFLPNYPWIS